MKTLKESKQVKDITKYQARQAIYTFQFANEELSHKNIDYLLREALCDPRFTNIRSVQNGFVYRRTSEGTTYEFPINKDTMSVHDILKINDTVVSIGYLVGFLNDLTILEQEQALNNLFLQPIEKYLSKRTGVEIKLKKEIFLNAREQWQMNLKTDNLIKKAGLCKAMLDEIIIECSGIHYDINKYTGEQYLYIPSFNFYYTHIGGGHNGHEMGKVRWNDKKAEFEGFNYKTEKFEKIK